MINKKYYLMLKQHDNTKLKYLCFHYGTKESCFTYKGSGKYWTSHLSKHGKTITTTILLESDNQSDIAKAGIEYSLLWDVVKSCEFANLTIEDAQSTAEPLQRPEVRLKRNQSLKDRIKTCGLTPKEKEARRRGVTACQQLDVRERAANTLRYRLATTGQTEKEMLRSINTLNRIQTKGFTEKELASHKKTSERQLGITIRERLGDPNYIDPRKGKTAEEIYGSDYTGPWNKGKTMKELIGEDYIDPRSRPFNITSQAGVNRYSNTFDFLNSMRFSGPQFLKLKRNGQHTIKRQSNTKHPYIHGETIYFNYCDEL